MKYVVDIFCPLVAKYSFSCGYKQERDTNHLCYNVEVQSSASHILHAVLCMYWELIEKWTPCTFSSLIRQSMTYLPLSYCSTYSCIMSSESCHMLQFHELGIKNVDCFLFFVITSTLWYRVIFFYFILFIYFIIYILFMNVQCGVIQRIFVVVACIRNKSYDVFCGKCRN